MTSLLDRVAKAICKSRTCEGISCCQWPAQRGRTDCPVKRGAYDEAASAAIEAVADDMREAGEENEDSSGQRRERMSPHPLDDVSPFENSRSDPQVVREGKAKWPY